MKYSYIFFGFFSSFAFISQLIFWFYSFVWFFIQVILLAGLAAIITHSLKKSPTTFRHSFTQSFLVISSSIGVITSMFVWLIAYHNYNPASLSDVTIENGSGSVVFLQMSHIASSEFYRQKQEKIYHLSQSGYTILYEWVKPGSQENHDKFDAYMWFQFTDTLYDSIALLTWFEAQDNDMLFGWVPKDSLVSVDLSIDQIVSIIGDSSPIVSWELPDIDKELWTVLANINDRDKKILNYIFKWFLNWTLKNSGDIETSLMQSEKVWVFRAIIEKRNDPIVAYIQDNPDKKIAIVYGGLHFNWVYAWLQKLSDKRNILKIEQTYPYR